MNILALDTSADRCQVALLLGEEVIAEEVAHSRHSEHVLAVIRGVLDRHQVRPDALGAVAFGCGPGAFTGLRIGAGVAQGLALGWGIPAVPVSTLAAMAHGAPPDAGVFVAIDARMGEVYTAAFAPGTGPGSRLPVPTEWVGKPENIVAPSTGVWRGIGNGWQLYGEAFRAVFGPQRILEVLPEPRSVARNVALLAREMLQRGEIATDPVPVYVRDQVALAKRSVILPTI